MAPAATTQHNLAPETMNARAPTPTYRRALRYFAPFTLLLATGVAVAAGVRLGAIVDMARSADAQYGAARAAADAGREKLPQALAGLRPTVNLTYTIKHNRDGSGGTIAYPGTLGYEGQTGALVVTQPLFRVANKVNAEEAGLQVQLAEQQLTLAEQDLLLRVARSYFDVLQARDELSVAVAQKEALRLQLAQARRSFEVGSVPITDLNEAQARHDLAAAQEIAARNDLESRKRILERSIARPLPPLARLTETANVEVLDARQQAALVDAAPRQALPVLIGRTMVEVADKEIARRDAGRQPTLDLVGSVSSNQNLNYGASGGQNLRQSSIGLEFTFPLYEGGAVSSRTREAIADRQRADEELTQAQRQALLDAQQAQLGVESGSAMVRALRQAVASSESQLHSTQRGQEVGIRTRVDVLNAEQQLYTARKDLASARYRTLVSSLQLKAAAGALTESDLRGLDALLGD
jgi:outer membrane protein